jgi:Tfp pilus assembly protein FimT
LARLFQSHFLLLTALIFLWPYFGFTLSFMPSRAKLMKLHPQSGQSLLEIAVVMGLLIILAAIALPTLRGSRNVNRWSGLQRELVSELRNARQAAMGQRAPITVRFDNTTKRLVIYGGSFGAAGAGANRQVRLARGVLQENEVIYGRPAAAPTGPLPDATNLTPLAANQVEITFQPDGSVLDAGGNPVATGLFFYYNEHPGDTAFAVTVLGFGGRVKLWSYAPATNVYVE